MKAHLLLMIMLLAGLRAGCQTINPRPSSSASATPFIKIPVTQAKVIDRSLRNYERLKPAYVTLRKANLGWRSVHEQDSLVISGQVKLIDWYKQSFAVEQQLRQDADKKVLIWRGKARRRGVLIGIGVGAPAAFGLYQLLK